MKIVKPEHTIGAVEAVRAATGMGVEDFCNQYKFPFADYEKLAAGSPSEVLPPKMQACAEAALAGAQPVDGETVKPKAAPKRKKAAAKVSKAKTVEPIEVKADESDTGVAVEASAAADDMCDRAGVREAVEPAATSTGDKYAEDTTADSDDEFYPLPPEKPVIGVMAAADPATHLELMERAGKIETVDDASAVILAAAAALCSPMQAAQLIKKIAASAPKSVTIPKAAMQSEFKTLRKAAVQEIKEAAEEEGGDTSNNLADYLLDLAEKNGFRPWKDDRLGTELLQIGPAHHVRAKGQDATDAFIRLYDKNPCGGRRVCPPDNIRTVQGVFAARVSADAATKASGMRYAGIVDDDLVLHGVVIDLGDDTRNGLYVTANGWKVISSKEIDNLDVVFVRAPDTTAYIMPVEGKVKMEDAIDAVMNVFAVRDRDSAKALLVSLAVSMMPSPWATFLIIALAGVPGAGKTSAARNIKRLLDPSSNKGSRKPKSDEDLIVQAATTRCLVLDNLRYVTGDYSDTICTIATGINDSKRALFTDDGLHIKSAHAAQIITSIEARLFSRADIIDRLVTFSLVIRNARMTELQLERLAMKSSPVIMNAMLQMLVAILKHTNANKHEEDDRMATMALAIKAIDEEWPHLEFYESYAARRRAAAKASGVTNALVHAVVSLALANPPGGDGAYRWVGSTTEMFHAIETKKETGQGQSWPTTSIAMGIRMGSLAPLLKLMGVTHAVKRTSSGVMQEIVVPADQVDALREAALMAGAAFVGRRDIKSEQAARDVVTKCVAEIQSVLNQLRIKDGKPGDKAKMTPAAWEEHEAARANHDAFQEAIDNWAGEHGIQSFDKALPRHAKEIEALVKALAADERFAGLFSKAAGGRHGIELVAGSDLDARLTALKGGGV